MRTIGFMCLLIPILSFGGNLDRIRKALQKAEFDKALDLIERAREKEPANPGVDYFLALLLSNEVYSNFNLDSSRAVVTIALEKFEHLDDEAKGELADDNITLRVVEELEVSIRDRIFDSIKQSLSINSIEEFLVKYPSSPYETKLIYQRDSIAFDNARRDDSIEAYDIFIRKYNTIEFIKKSNQRLDELRFGKLKGSQRLETYYQFLKDYPRTVFRGKIESFIFRKSTANHLKDSYLQFIEYAKTPGLRKRAADLLFYLSGQNEIDAHPLKDSITWVKGLIEDPLLPALENGKFGFHSADGELRIPYQYIDISYDMKCEMTTDEWLLVADDSKKIIGKSGNTIIPELEEYEDLGHGLALVQQDGKTNIYHKSGFKIIEDDIEAAEVLGGRWIKLRKNGAWGLVSFSGYEISRYQFDHIEVNGLFWIFERDGLIALTTEELIANQLDDTGIDLEFKFDDLELVSDSVVIGFRENRECMLDESLKFLIPWGEYEINPDDSGWYLKTSSGYRLYDHSEQDIMNQIHPYLETNRGWLALKTTTDWMLLPRRSEELPSRGYDSLKLINNYCVYALADGKEELIFQNGARLRLEENASIRTFINQPEFVRIDQKNEKLVVDKMSNEILRGNFEEISFFNDSLLKVERRAKVGILRLDGEYLLDIKYDAIDHEDGMALCLLSGKIGSYDLVNNVWLAPKYEARVERISDFYLARANGKYGVVDSKEVEVLPYSYDEIRYWNDSSFLVRNESNWSFLDLEGEQIGESVEFLSLLVESENESIWKYVSEGKYGLLSSKNGILLKPEFTDIFNIGTLEIPIFFADQHLDKAGFHVVSYISSEGSLILSKAYRNEEFDRILCDD